MLPATPSSFPLLVGRHTEQTELRGLLGHLKAGRGQIVLIAGEAGIGKTALVRDLTLSARDEGILAFTGACYDMETTPPYGPWLNTGVLNVVTSENTPTSETRSVTPERQRILELLSHQGPARPADVASELGLSPNAANQTLRRMLQEGLVSQPSYGTYSVSAESEAELSSAHASEVPLVQQLYHRQQQIEGGTQQALFGQVYDVLETRSRHRPLVLVLEDLHWADQASVELLRFIARQVQNLPILMVATYRDVDLTARHPLYRLLPYIVRESQAIRINLRRLDAASIQELVTRRYELTEADARRLVNYLVRQTEGNPFFIEEVLLALEANRTVQFLGDRWLLQELTDVTVPPLVRQVIDGRLEHLDDRARELLQQAAVIGAEVPLEIWQQVTDADDNDLIACIDQAYSAQLIVETSGFLLSFRHALIRDALYAQVLPLRRRVWHIRIADALIGLPDPDPATVAYHLEQGNDPRVIEWHVKAGDRARELYAPETAIDHYSSALACAGRTGTPAPLSVIHQRGLSFMTIGNFDAARQDFEDAFRAAQAERDDVMVWHVLADLGALWGERDYARAGEYLRQALDLAREIGDPGKLATSLNRLGNWHLNIQEMDHSIELYQDALEIFDQTGNVAGRAASFDLLAMGKALRGDLIDAEKYAWLALDEYRNLNDRRGEAQALSHLTLCAVLSVHDPLVPAAISSDDAREAGMRSIEIARDIGWRAGEAYCNLIIGLFEISRSRFAQALHHSRTGLDIAVVIQHRQWQALAHNAMARIYHDVLQWDRARDHAERELRLGREVNSKIWTFRASADLALALVEIGETDMAEGILDAAFSGDAPGMSAEQIYCHYARAAVLNSRGESDRALQLIERTETSVPCWGPSSISPRLALLKGQVLSTLGQFDDALSVLTTARDVVAAHDARGFQWRIELELARVCRALGHITEARDAHESVETMVREIAADIDDSDISMLFVKRVNEMLASVAPNVPSNLTIGGLSARQIEVLRLVAQGLTDAEIGERLFISTRTVNGHLQSIYNKLGISSRTAATAFAYENGLMELTAG